jgi:hypothetical protein
MEVEVKIENYYSNHPSMEDYHKYSTELIKPNIIRDSFYKKGDSHRTWMENIDIDAWIEVLIKRLSHAEKSYVYGRYYYDLGIPDDPWCEKGNGSIKLFPNFTINADHIKKDMFDYYSDIYFYKIFSALETIGHLFFKKYSLQVNERSKISFNSSVGKLKGKNPNLHEELLKIINSDEFKQGIEIRNDETHNYPHSEITSGVVKKPDSLSMGISHFKYIQSKDIQKSINEMWDIVVKIFDVINSHSR